MNFKYILILLIALMFMGSAGAGAFDKYDIEYVGDVQFSIPHDYELKYENETFKSFKNSDLEINITVSDNKTLDDIDEIESNKTVKAEMTMIGSVEGYLVDYNNTNFNFTYEEDGKLVNIMAPTLSDMIDVIDKDR